MVILACLILIAAVAYSMAMEGLAEAVIVLVITLISGFLALAIHQPVAEYLSGKFSGGMAEGTEDAIALIGSFCLTAGALRWVSQVLLPWQISFPGLVNQVGGAVVGLIIGWLGGGIFVLALATLPWPADSWGMESPVAGNQTPTPLRAVFPSDLVWLGGARRMSANNRLGHGPSFDSDGSYLIRFGRHRTGWNGNKAQPFKGEPYSIKR